MTTIHIPAASLDVECAPDDTILRAALRQGLGFPYECNVGSCGNCLFELLSGEVEHLRVDSPGWSERHKQRNRWLGCQAKPLSECSIKVSLRDHYKPEHRPTKVMGKLFAIEDHTHDMREFRFRLSQPVGFRPGQYALIQVPGVEGARAYSMCNVTATGEEWHFQIRRTPNGACTSALFDHLALGEELALDGPYGMAFLREDAPRDILCLAGGSGLSPMVSITRAAAASEKLQDRKVHFIYGGRAARDIAGEPMLRELPGYGTRVFYHAATSEADDDASWTGLRGFVHDVAREMFGADLAKFEIYFAGPPPMAKAVMKLAVDHGAPLAQVHFDQFY